ncbi:MAG: hypothetical protein JW741_02220 [Sedimentisphaerales bacterium]|nr:hypothetical protein [Sedimentisphaerales bacterium]
MEEQTESMTLIEQVKADKLAKRRAAAKQLREILLRANKPQRGDKDALPELMGVLGVTFDDLASLQECVNTAARYAALLEEEGENAQASRKLHVELAQVDEWAADEHLRVDKEAESKRAAIRPQLGEVNRKRAEITQARQQAVNIAAPWIALREGITVDEARKYLAGVRPNEQLAAM